METRKSVCIATCTTEFFGMTNFPTYNSSDRKLFFTVFQFHARFLTSAICACVMTKEFCSHSVKLIDTPCTSSSHWCFNYSSCKLISWSCETITAVIRENKVISRVPEDTTSQLAYFCLWGSTTVVAWRGKYTIKIRKRSHAPKNSQINVEFCYSLFRPWCHVFPSSV